MIVLTGLKSALPQDYVRHSIVPQVSMLADKDVEKDEVVMDSRKRAKKKKDLLCKYITCEHCHCMQTYYS